MRRTKSIVDLPYEVVSEILSHMSIVTVKNLRSALQYDSKFRERCKYQSIDDVCRDRESVWKYLQKHFGNASKLLESMSKNFVYMSGSRSLEFFNPGVTATTSDWDFYLPQDKPHNLEAFMITLESFGVVWLSPEQELEKYVVDGAEPLVVEEEKYEYLIHSLALQEYARSTNLRLTRPQDETLRVGARPNMYRLSISNGELAVSCVDHGWSYPTGNLRSIVRGTLLRRGSETPVQLICEKRDTDAAVSALFEYHSSCVQSFIGPYSAGHMYANLTSDSKTYGWADNVTAEPAGAVRSDRGHVLDPVGSVSQVHQWNKYRNRGFEYVRPHMYYPSISLRTIRDYGSLFIEYNYESAAPHDVVDLYTELSASLAWHEVESTTVRVPRARAWFNWYNNMNFCSWFDDRDPEAARTGAYLHFFVPQTYARTDRES